MWEASIAAIQDDEVSSSVVFHFINKDDGKEFKTDWIKGFRSDGEIKAEANRKVSNITTNKGITLKVGDIIDLSGFITPPPTDKDLQQQAYTNGRDALMRLKLDLDLGLTDQATYDKALAYLLAIKP